MSLIQFDKIDNLIQSLNSPGRISDNDKNRLWQALINLSNAINEINQIEGDESSFLTIININTNQALNINQNGFIIKATETITLRLPLPTLGLKYIIKNMGTGVITIVGLIDGFATYSLTNLYQYIGIIGDGTQWLIVEKN